MNLADNDLVAKVEQKSATKSDAERNEVSALIRQYYAHFHGLKICTDLLSGYVTGKIQWQQFKEAKPDAVPT